MKYIIDVQKISGTNLWKAKEFNTLVFDKNGLDKLQELNMSHIAIRLENKLQKVEYLQEEIEKLEHSNKSLKGMLRRNGDLLHKAVKEKKEIQEYNNHLEKEWKYFDNICTKLKNENEDLQKKLVNDRFKNEVCSQQLEEKSDKISKLANEKAELLEKINSLDNKLLEKSVPIEEVVEYASLEETIDKKTHSTREYQRLFNTVKSQKGMLKKQGKDISRLQKETKELKQRCKFEEVERLRESIEKLVTENENLKTELKKLDPFE